MMTHDLIVAVHALVACTHPEDRQSWSQTHAYQEQIVTCLNCGAFKSLDEPTWTIPLLVAAIDKLARPLKPGPTVEDASGREVAKFVTFDEHVLPITRSRIRQNERDELPRELPAAQHAADLANAGAPEPDASGMVTPGILRDLDEVSIAAPYVPQTVRTSAARAYADAKSLFPHEHRLLLDAMKNGRKSLFPHEHRLLLDAMKNGRGQVMEGDDPSTVRSLVARGYLDASGGLGHARLTAAGEAVAKWLDLHGGKP